MGIFPVPFHKSRRKRFYERKKNQQTRRMQRYGRFGSSSSTTASSAAGSGAAASNERITVRILKSKAANEVAAEQMDVWKILGEKFNMDFEFDNPPQDNYNERLNLVMMDAQLPDIIMDMPTTEVLKYGESGVILSLNDYIENDMPNLKKEIDKRDGVEKALTYSDGNIYYMPMLDEAICPTSSAPTGWKSWASKAP